MSAASSASDDVPWPESIVNHEASGVLELRWADGRDSRLSHAMLRAHCRCAGCEQARRATAVNAEVDESIRLNGIHPVSDKGLNLVFSDGHGRGIFPWAYLRELGLNAAS